MKLSSTTTLINLCVLLASPVLSEQIGWFELKFSWAKKEHEVKKPYALPWIQIINSEDFIPKPQFQNLAANFEYNDSKNKTVKSACVNLPGIDFWKGYGDLQVQGFTQKELTSTWLAELRIRMLKDIFRKEDLYKNPPKVSWIEIEWPIRELNDFGEPKAYKEYKPEIRFYGKKDCEGDHLAMIGGQMSNVDFGYKYQAENWLKHEGGDKIPISGSYRIWTLRQPVEKIEQ